VVPGILAIVVGVFAFYPEFANRLVFLPLALYALYGVLKKNKKKNRHIEENLFDETYKTIAK
jgi:CDP-diacylglycerol--serine O-phosphatidyltransferase